MKMSSTQAVLQRLLDRCRAGAAWAAAAWTAAAFMLASLSACNNNPWPDGAAKTNTIFTGVVESSPRHLDPTASYWSNDTPYTYQIYEPPYGYHYLKRPYQLVAKSAAEVVQPRYIDKDGRPLPDDAPVEQIAESIYEVPIRPGIMFQPHPAFAKDEQGAYRYHSEHPMKPGDLGDRVRPLDFEHQGTRELVAEDFVYALKRHATTRIVTPVFSTFAEFVVGLKEYGELVKKEDAKLRQGLDPADQDKPFLDFRRWPLAGVSAPEKHLLRVRIKGKYPQWGYWMQMTFTAPIPWEADAFYAQPGLAAVGLSLDRWPVGTGPYMMSEFIQDRRHELVRNPNYRRVPYPCDGMPDDKSSGLLDDCGKPTPFVDKVVFTVEREGLPLTNKFRQGFYDIEVYERTDTGKKYQVAMQDSEQIRKEYTEKGFQLNTNTDVNSYYIAFNMLDPTIGDGSDAQQKARNRKLRQAISIAIDWEEYAKIFPSKAGMTAMSPLPPGIWGSREGTEAGLNPVTHVWKDGQPVRRPIEDAKKLMVEAGYPNGRDAQSGRPLVLNYDFYAAATPERRPEIDWVVRQFAKIDIQLEVRATDNSQFQDKARKGSYQVFWLGWNADYPDPENFLFLLTGSAGKTKHGGENYSNYDNPEFDRLFDQMKSADNGPARQQMVDKLVRITQEDAPWTMGFFPYASAARQHWIGNYKPAVLIRDQGRYIKLDVDDRVQRLAAWNKPVWWPVLLMIGAVLALVWVVLRSLRRRERTTARGAVVN